MFRKKIEKSNNVKVINKNIINYGLYMDLFCWVKKLDIGYLNIADF